MELKDFIIEKSKELNIDIVGFTSCEPFENLREYLRERKKNNIEIEFEEKDIEKRLNPSLTLPTCQSIIVVAMSYNNGFNKVPNYRLKGRISRSSWGRDYHRVLGDKIEGLIGAIKTRVDFNYEYFIDTGPLIERELAKRAGIGYYGKNCSIINDKYGSFIFIGYILTDLELVLVEKEVANKCGACRLCLKACPTGALEGPFKFNPNKCVSYLTQTRKKIPYELREKIGDKIYGCDVCQLACPKNKNITIPDHKNFIPRKTQGYIDIEEILTMSNREFKEKYGHMAGSWRGKNILKRNGIIVLGNTRDRKNLKLLLPLLKDPSPMIRKYTAWAILNIDYLKERGVIEKAMKGEKDPKVKREMEDLIKYFKEK